MGRGSERRQPPNFAARLAGADGGLAGCGAAKAASVTIAPAAVVSSRRPGIRHAPCGFESAQSFLGECERFPLVKSLHAAFPFQVVEAGPMAVQPLRQSLVAAKRFTSARMDAAGRPRGKGWARAGRLPLATYPARSCSEMTTPGRSLSQITEAIHQRFPSWKSWMLLTPRTTGSSPSVGDERRSS
jgi:hypothetical protein